MKTAAAGAPRLDNRLLKLKKLHALARSAGLDDDTYRDRLERATGKRSAKECSEDELDRALATFHVKHANHPHTAMAKALFISAYNLGAFESGTDAALDAFANRQTGKARLAFLTPAEANAVTEALKAICKREGFAVPDTHDGGMNARRALLLAQWAKLSAMGAVKNGCHEALDRWISHRIVPRTDCYLNLKRHELDQAAIALGRWIRRAKG